METSGDHFDVLLRIRRHTKALQDIKRGNNLRKVDSDATHDFLLPPPPQPGVQGWRQKSTFICNPKPKLFEVQYFKRCCTLPPFLLAYFKKCAI